MFGGLCSSEPWLHFFGMFLLYIDESGSLENPGDHFVVGGIAIHEADVRRFNRRIEDIVARHLDEHLRRLELHAQAIRTGKGPWGAIPHPVKQGLLADMCRLLGSFGGHHGNGLFAVVRAPNAVPSADPFERVFEELLLRFTQMLIRLRHAGDDQMGIVVADEARYEATLQPIVQRWRDEGTRFARLGRLAEVPLFIDSRATRLTQAADFVAHAAYRMYAAQDPSLFQPMLNRFDTDRGVLHGLLHLIANYRTCICPACVSRATAADLRRV